MARLSRKPAAPSPRLAERIGRFPLFEPVSYLRAHPDVVELEFEALEHLLGYGLVEGRLTAAPEHVAGVLGALAREPLAFPPPATALALGDLLSRAQGRVIEVHVAPGAEIWTRCFAERMVADLEALGVQARLQDEGKAPNPLAPDPVVAVGPGALFSTTELTWGSSRMARTVMVLPDGPETAGFYQDLRWALSGAAVVSPYPEVAELFRRAGLPAQAWFPGARDVAEDEGWREHPLAQGLPSAARDPLPDLDVWAGRPLDVVFQGGETEARDEFFGRAGATLADLCCAIQYQRPLGPAPAWRPGDRRPALARALGRRSKIVLNLHEGEFGPLHWRSVLNGIEAGALVVSAPCLRHPLFEPGVHYLEDSPRRLPKLIQWLVQDPEGARLAEQVRRQAQAKLRIHGSTLRLTAGLLRLLLKPR